MKKPVKGANWFLLTSQAARRSMLVRAMPQRYRLHELGGISGVHSWRDALLSSN